MPTDLVEYLATVRLGERGTMTLPKEYRDAANLQTGTPLTMLRIGEGLLLIPERKRFDELCEAIASRLERAGVTDASLQATLPDVRESLVRRRYPELFTEKKPPAKTLRKKRG